MLSPPDTAALVAAGALGGLVGTAGGITSLISYPALLAVGVPALPAAVANRVAFVACLPGVTLASRPELRGRGRWLIRWATLTAAGGCCGAVLLELTPPGTFSRVVPFLVAGASLALLVAPRLQAWRAGRADRSWRPALRAALVALSFYDGYFGAGSGVMTLTVLLVLVEPDLPTANALKNVLLDVGSTVAAVVYVVAGPVDWAAAVPLGIGMAIGSVIGPLVARRLPQRVLRILVVLLGFALAVQLWVNPG
ncbi:MAG: sulfite exporter TauE/SafE family protein [Solirubrobacteraceae bacterium]